MAGDNKLISEYREIHASTDWGGTSIKNIGYILPHIESLSPISIIDYGCGKSALLDAIDVSSVVTKVKYDPAIPEYDKLDPGPYDLLLNVDVLEHIPEEALDEVLTEMARISTNAILIVDTKPAKLKLSNGENAHVCLHNHAWWQQKLEQYFGTLYAIKVRRSGRAAFRTWPIGSSERINLAGNNLATRVKLWLKLK